MRKYIYTLTERQQLSPTARILTLRPPVRESVFPFVPGQYVAIAFRNLTRHTPTRCFSIVSSPDQTDLLQLGIRIDGTFTHSIDEQTIGTPVTVYGPFGSFAGSWSTTSPAVFIAGGIGITPFMSMIRSIRQQSPSQPTVLLYSVQSRNDIPFLDELRTHRRDNPNFYYAIHLTRDTVVSPEDSDMLVGRLTPASISRMAPFAPGVANYYICGPASFMDGMTSALKELGIDTSHIHTEAFSQTAPTNTVKSLPFTIYTATALSFSAVWLGVATTDYLKHASAVAAANISPISTPAVATAVPTIVPTSTPTPVPTTTTTPLSVDGSATTPAPTTIPTTIPTATPTVTPTPTPTPDPTPYPTQAPIRTTVS